MRMIIAVLSCERDRELHNQIRGSWGAAAKSLGIQTRFFVSANPQKYENDEIHLACQDTRQALPYKVREACKWASAKSLDYIFFCHTDTRPEPAKLLTLLSPMLSTRVDYAGRFDKPIDKPFRYDEIGADGMPEHINNCYPWASGGFGYFLSHGAFSEIAGTHPTSSVDDLWVGQVLGAEAAEGRIHIQNIEEPYSTHKGEQWDASH